jgi:hypothetical protein
MSIRILVIASGLSVLLTGCVTNQQRYGWGTYDPSLYAYYKDPSKESDLADSLVAIMSTADSHHAAVPPGIYAEYGYLQLQIGKSDVAVHFFQQEEEHWPESKVFMDRMIKVATTQAATSTTK